jgi:hypothetical protein
MTTELKELFQTSVLRVLDANRTRWGLGTSAIALRLKPLSFSVSSFSSVDEFYAAIADALQYWCDKHFAEEVDKPAHPANRVWRITAGGIEHLDQWG